MKWFAGFSADILTKNRGNGIYLDFQWVMTYQVKSQ
jgi:hypothetical protein